MAQVVIPSGWQAHGHLPPFDMKFAREQDVALMACFTASVLQVVDPLGLYVIDVGWYPDGSVDGSYWCRLMRMSEPGVSVQEAQVPELAGVRTWLEAAIDTVRRRIAQ